MPTPLEKLRNWRPRPVQAIWIVFDDMYGERDRPLAAFHSEADAIDFCVDQMLDDDPDFGDVDIDPIEWCRTHWDDRYVIRSTTLYPTR